MLNPTPNLDELLQTAGQHHQAGRLSSAEAVYRQIFREDPKHVDALHRLGVLAFQVSRPENGIDLIRQAIALRPTMFEAWLNLGNGLNRTGRLDEAAEAYRQAIVLKPGSPEAHYHLGNVLQGSGHFEEAIAAYRQAIALKPNSAEFHYNLGVTLADAGRLDEAVEEYQKAIALKPNFPEAYSNLGNALSDKRLLKEAVAAYRQAIALKPNYPNALSNLGNVLGDVGQFDEAIMVCRQALALQPNFAKAYYNLGNALRGKGQLDEAIAAYREAVTLQSDYLKARNNLANTLTDAGQLHEAVAAYREILALKPDYHEAHSNLLLNLHYHPDQDAQALAQEHHRWNRQYASQLKQDKYSRGKQRHAERRLRIGYVSADFCRHSVGNMVFPLLAHHDHTRFEIFCYAQVTRPDVVTALFRSHADHWHDTASWSDEQLAEKIQRDSIDILVDLAGHTGGNRLLVFARKPAPVQVTYLGYPNTTGLEAMDYRLTDALADPPGSADALHSEKLVRLPKSNWIHQPPQDGLELPPAPFTPHAQVTFGSFNNFSKVTDPMLRLWARILTVVPGSRLLLKAQALGPGGVQQRVREAIGRYGISADRLDFDIWRPGVAEHLQQYHRVTIALDTFPYHGTTTTCEALWMGVPVITLAGKTHVSRVGVSLLTNLGLPELVAHNPEEYVQLAVSLANDPARLAELHATLRQRMEASPLMDATGFAREIESAYRQMWRTWCGTQA